MPKYKIIIDEETCIGCGTCVALCPDNFELKGDKAVVVKDQVDNLECVSDAIDSCPVDAITSEEK